VRLFVAVWPPPEVVAALAEVPRPALPDVRWTTPDRWHVTLRFLGDVASPDDAVAALSSVVAPVADAVVGPAVALVGRRILCVPVSGLEGVAEAVITATAGIGEPPPSRPFTGHVTLARTRGGGARGAAGAAGAAINVRWTVDAVQLVRSHLSPRGARYETVASQPLG
jgi:2'-5' RNA ligase